MRSKPPARKYPSGAEKRKKKQRLDDAAQSQMGDILNFFGNKGQVESSSETVAVDVEQRNDDDNGEHELNEDVEPLVNEDVKPLANENVEPLHPMAFGLPAIISHPKRSLRLSLSNTENSIVPKGYIAVYVGESSEKKRFVVPISYLNHPLFHDLLNQAEEEFGFNHPMGGLTIPCDEETFIDHPMAFGLPAIISRPKRSLRRSLSNTENLTVPKGHIAVYVGESEKKRFVVPISYLNHPLFHDLLNQAEEEFGFNHPMGGLTIPCNKEAFIDITSQLN
ncbi:hypothetical protein IFM89_035495 [Coptis chinensis]|uniref:Small auxin up regulated protein n=1 Tax=Coptis chinensis TaxID=261450 RepID=A0A835HPM3_9MAGN|nr:hypothetical protein IFM89_035495 [Coptis chinensis]